MNHLNWKNVCVSRKYVMTEVFRPQQLVEESSQRTENQLFIRLPWKETKKQDSKTIYLNVG